MRNKQVDRSEMRRDKKKDERLDEGENVTGIEVLKVF